MELQIMQGYITIIREPCEPFNQKCIIRNKFILMGIIS
jgi:hypothetical protein